MSYSLLDVRVLAFSLTITVLTGLLFGVLPVLGVVGASAVGRSLGSLIPEAMPVGLATSMALAISLSAAAAITIWSATRRIPQLDIIRLLRAE